MFEFSINLDSLDFRLKNYLPREGWISRQSVITSLQSAFSQSPCVIIFGENGTGKSTTAAAFARHQITTGATGNQPVIYTSFQQISNISDLLESFGQVYELALLEKNIDWQTLDDIQRHKLIQDLLEKVPLLWIWDDFESIHLKTSIFWIQEDKQKLVNLIQSIPQGGGTILILSDNQEKEILGDSSARLELDLNSPNLVARQILFDIDPDKPSQPQDLPETLHCVLENFNKTEQEIITLLGLFSGIVNLAILIGLTDKVNPWVIDDLVDIDPEVIKKVLDKGSKYHICTPISTTDYYLIHPAVSTRLSRRLNPEKLRKAQRAFTQAMSIYSRQTIESIHKGGHELIDLLAVQEVNLRNALGLAVRFRWRRVALDLLCALSLVFQDSRRLGSWNRLLDRVSHLYFHPDSLQPVSQNDQLEKEFIHLKVDVNIRQNRLNDAARWQSMTVMAIRNQLKKNKVKRAIAGDIKIKEHELAISLSELGDIYRKLLSPKSIEVYIEAFQITKNIGDTHLEAELAQKIAEAYLVIPVAQNFDHAKDWIETGMGVTAENDLVMLSRFIALQGKAAYEKFSKGQKNSQPVEEQVSLLNQALEYHFRALDILPDNSSVEKGNLLEMIGFLYLQSEGMAKTAEQFYEQAINEMIRADNLTGAARASYNLAVGLFLLIDLENAEKYARTALDWFEQVGIENTLDAHKIRQFLKRIEDYKPLPESTNGNNSPPSGTE